MLLSPYILVESTEALHAARAASEPAHPSYVTCLWVVVMSDTVMLKEIHSFNKKLDELKINPWHDPETS